MTTTRFTDGTTGSESQVAQAFTELRLQGQSSIDELVVLRENTLLLFNNALSELNGKRVKINRLPEVGIAAKFLTSDLQDINQSITTASVRADSNSFSLRERSAPGETIVNQVRFSASEGTIQALQVPQTGSSGNLGALYRVATATGTAPVGTFDIQLLDQVSISLVIFDMMNTPSSAQIQAFISQNGINFIPADSVTRNGYRLAAWFTPQEIKYIRITITPALPDILGGSVFTFGLTDLHAFSVQYHLRSDVYTNQIVIAPRSASLKFSTLSTPGLLYFLSLAGNPALEITPGQIIPIPGTSTFTNVNAGLLAPAGSAWIASHAYIVGNTVLDSNGNLQTVTAIAGSGTSDTVAPSTVDPLTAVANASAGNTSYTGTFSPTLPAGSVVIAGFTTTANNGTFTIVSCSATILVVNNPSGVAQTHAGTATFNPWSIKGGTTIDHPGGNQITWTETAWARLNYILPANVYLSTVHIIDHVTKTEIRLAPGLSKTSTGVINQYFAVVSDPLSVDFGKIYLLIYNNAVDQTRTFDISYVAGPATVSVSLQVELTTSDLNTTPIYSGSELIEV